MNLGYLAFRNMVSRPLNLILSLLLVSLSVSLVTFVLQFSRQVDDQLYRNTSPFDMVVGAKGSPLQLVLSSVLHVDVPTGNIALSGLKEIQNHPFVEWAIPVSYGDNFKGFRILGTEPDYLDQYEAGLASGKLYGKSFEAVAGSDVVRKLGLKVGDRFVSSHGLAASSLETHDEHGYTVTGILEPTGTVVDQLLITNLESIWLAHDHGDSGQGEEGGVHEEGHAHDEENPHEDGHTREAEHSHDEGHSHEAEHRGYADSGEAKEITSLLVKFKSPLGMVQLPRYINENTAMQAALPGFEVQRLLGLLGSGVQVVNGIALAILLVSALSIFISLLITIRERKQELALLRTYGLRTRELLGLALLEGLFLALIGFVLGWLLGRFGLWVLSLYTRNTYGYPLSITGPEGVEFGLLALILTLAGMAALLASGSIFKLNIAKTLSDA